MLPVVFQSLTPESISIESFRVFCPNLLIVRARTDPDLPSLMIFAYFIELSRILDNEANRRRCPRGSHDA